MINPQHTVQQCAHAVIEFKPNFFCIEWDELQEADFLTVRKRAYGRTGRCALRAQQEQAALPGGLGRQHQEGRVKDAGILDGHVGVVQLGVAVKFQGDLIGPDGPGRIEAVAGGQPGFVERVACLTISSPLTYMCVPSTKITPLCSQPT